MTEHDRSTNSLATRGRPLVLGAAIAWLIGSALAVFGAQLSWLWLAAVAVFFACWWGAKIASRNIADRGADDVDEYEREQRDRARGLGYGVTLVGGAVVLVLLVVAVQLADRGHPELLHQAPVLLGMGLLPGAAAPTLWLAWQLRVDPDDFADPGNERPGPA